VNGDDLVSVEASEFDDAKEEALYQKFKARLRKEQARDAKKDREKLMKECAILVDERLNAVKLAVKEEVRKMWS
jgi:hypothetical protein